MKIKIDPKRLAFIKYMGHVNEAEVAQRVQHAVDHQINIMLDVTDAEGGCEVCGNSPGWVGHHADCKYHKDNVPLEARYWEK